MEARSIEDTLITQQLDERAPRRADSDQEIEAYCRLAEEVVQSADNVVTEIAPLARELCHAGSAGISLMETDGAANAVIRWEAVAGQLSPSQGLVMPRDSSPCGLSAERGAPLLFDRPGRGFAAFQQLRTGGGIPGGAHARARGAIARRALDRDPWVGAQVRRHGLPHPAAPRAFHDSRPPHHGRDQATRHAGS